MPNPGQIRSASPPTAARSAAILDAQGRHREALVPMREALALVETVLGRDHYEVALLLRTLGEIAERAGESAQAVAHYRRALEHPAPGPRGRVTRTSRKRVHALPARV